MSDATTDDLPAELVERCAKAFCEASGLYKWENAGRAGARAVLRECRYAELVEAAEEITGALSALLAYLDALEPVRDGEGRLPRELRSDDTKDSTRKSDSNGLKATNN